MNKIIGFIFCIVMIFVNTSKIYSCTGIYIHNDSITLAGNNEDWTDYKTKMWFVPSENGNFGRVYFGYSNFYPQGGMNEKGLFFDGFATAPHEVVNSEGKEIFNGNLSDYALATCSTVEEVIKLYKSYNLNQFKNFMLMFGDAHGKSVIIEGDDFIINEGEYQVCTNFCQSKTKTADIRCWRYLKADAMLKTNSGISVELCKSILQKVSQVGLTQYSNIYDLKNKKVYLYHFRNFDNVVEIDLQKELKKGKKSYDIASLFPINESFLEASKTPLNIKLLYFFLILSSIIFISTPITLILMKKRFLKTADDKDKSPFILYKPSQIIASVASIFMLIYILPFSQYPELFNTGLPENLQDLSTMETIHLKLPLLVLILTLALTILLIIVFYKKLWTKRIRIFYSFITVLLMINLVLLHYWNLIRI